MNRRLVLAVVAVAVLVSLAGCSAFFGGISDEELDREASYEDLRAENETVAVDVEGGGFISGGEFRAVYDLDDTEELSLYRTSFYREQALDVHGVRYWYPNGTAVTGSELDVDQGRSSTDVRVPDGNGTLAFSGSADRNSFQLPAFVEGSYVLYTPESYRTSNLLFGNVNPGGYDREVVDDRERLAWDDVDSTISLRYYDTRDVWLFVGVVAVGGAVGGTGIAYTYRQIQRLRRQREELGLDVEIDDDSDGPPPGFR